MRKWAYLLILLFFVVFNAFFWTLTYRAATAPSPEQLALAAAATPLPAASPAHLRGDGFTARIPLTGACTVCTGPWRYLQTGSELIDPFSKQDYFAPDLDVSAWRTMDLPQNWYLAGLNYQGVIWFRQEFTADPAWAKRAVQLRLDGVDYAADIWLNGEKLGSHTGYFAPFAFDMTGKLRDGKNELAVRVDSPWEEYDGVWPHRKTLIKGIYSQHDSRPGGAWSPAGQSYNTGGIWGDIYLDVTDAVTVDKVLVQAAWPTTASIGMNANVHAELALRNFGDEPLDAAVKVSFAPRNFDGPTLSLPAQTVKLSSGQTSVVVSGTLQPVLWWPWDRGLPNLYTTTVTVSTVGEVIARHEQPFGFRQVLVGEDWSWTVNGTRYFPRGSSYFSSQWLAQVDDAFLRRDLNLARDANLNMLRAYAHVEPQAFYDLADELGLLVWQDFPLNWGYTDAPAFVDEAQRQLCAMIEQAYNHPSIVLWAMHNNSPWQTPQLGPRMKEYDRRQNKRLDEVLFDEARKLDPTRAVLINSGSSDQHVYAGWDGGAWTDYADLPGAPMISEYGVQALPDFAAMVRMLPPDHITYRSGETRTRWEFHDFEARPTFDVAEIDPADSTTQFIANSQDYQANLLQFATESYRRAKFTGVQGIIQYSLVDAWPAISWSVLDSERQPKAGYTTLQTAMQPILPSIVAPSPDRLDGRRWVYFGGKDLAITLWIVNDLLAAYPDAQLRWRIVDSTSGQAILQDSQPVDVAPNASAQWAILSQLKLEPGAYDLEVTLDDAARNTLGRNTFFFTILPEPAPEQENKE